MKYIKKVVLKNFQSHRYSELEFDEHLNVIVGPSDHGKSAIIRGIKWALFNEPSGDFFIREGENECSVTVIFSDNTKVQRYRSNSKNLYLYYDSEGNETIYQGFGNTVPLEIKEKINISKIHLDTSETNSVNISEQLEGPFLLSESKAVRANAIGRLVGVHIIDDAIRHTVKEIINLNSSRRNLIKFQENLNEDLKKYDYLDRLEKDINEIDKLLLEMKEKKEKTEKLKKLNTELKVTMEEFYKINKVISKLDNINKIELYKENLKYRIKSYTLIVNNYNILKDLNKNIKYNSHIINKLINLEEAQAAYKLLEEKKEVFTKLLDTNKDYKKVNSYYDKNLNIVKKLKHTNKIDEDIKDLERFNNKLNKLVKLKTSLEDSNKRIVFGNFYLEKLSNVNTAEEFTNKINDLIVKKNKLISIKEKYDENIREINISKKKIKREELQTQKLLEEYNKLLSKLEVCPLCFSKIHSSTINNIIHNYR